VNTLLRTRPGRLVLQLLLPAFLLWLWWVTSENSTSYAYPPLSDVLERLREDWMFEQVPTDLLPSLGRFTAGYALAVVGGIAGGLVLGLMPRVQRAALPVTEFLRAIPPPLLLPFVIVTFGIGNGSKIIVIALGCVWVILLNAVDGVRSVDPVLLDTAGSFRMSRTRTVWRIVLPAASPQIAVGMRTGLAVGLIMMIISEMQGSTNGLGYQVLAAQRAFDTAGMFAGIIVIGLVGLVVNLGFVLAERRIMRWYRGARGLLDENEAARIGRRRERSTTPDDATAAIATAVAPRTTPRLASLRLSPLHNKEA
jgi:ABC-type nitrate/sulfonate/bicarbonate transport system permease component